MSIDLLSVNQVLERTGLHRSMLSRLRDAGKFPPSVHLGPKFIAWPSYAVDEWLKANPQGLRKPHKD